MSETPIAPAPAVAAPAAKPPAAPASAKPAAAKPPAKGGKERRFFLLALFGSWFVGGWTAFSLSMVGMLLGTIRFLYPNVLAEPPSKFKVGDPKQFEEGKVVERFKDQGTWIVRYQGEIYALSTTCTHLGCTPNWLEREGKFKCPCHGSGFKITGVNFEGPAPRPLERWAVGIAEDGQLFVDKSMKFQKELGQWSNPESFIKV
ncbi:MAG TPA: Rieske (2Fe-2S) protein [Gemmataceae bacterium]|jgi:cytochrome b6-f complex iron-sulfur subunit|nr:Rieske (2Fe-2S) protein [Gemmataceae bacterium]